MKLRNKLIATIVSISMVLAVIGVGAWASTESFTATITNTVNLEFDNITGQIGVIGMSGADNLEEEAPWMEEVLYDGSNVIYNQISSNATNGTNLYWDGTMFMDGSDDGLGMINARTEAAALMYAIVYEPTDDCVGTSTITAMVTETSLPEISGGKLLVKYFATINGIDWEEMKSGVPITPIADNELLMVMAVCQYYNLDGESISTIESAWDFSVTFSAGRNEVASLTGKVQLYPDPSDGVILPYNYTSPDESRWEIIEFGEYPQTLKANSVTITSETPDADGYYSGSDGERYAKLTATYGNSIMYEHYKMFVADDGTEMLDGQEYYFKVEPIRWRVLSDKGEKKLLLSDKILDIGLGETPLTDASGFYGTSQLRSFLINDFYNTAFTVAQQSQILTTHVDDSIAMKFSLDNSEIIENTEADDNLEDKVFALGLDDITNPRYGFTPALTTTDAGRIWKTTDYARATGAITFTREYANSIAGGDEQVMKMLEPYIGSGTMVMRTRGIADTAVGVSHSEHIALFLDSLYNTFDYPLEGCAPALYINA